MNMETPGATNSKSLVRQRMAAMHRLPRWMFACLILALGLAMNGSGHSAVAQELQPAVVEPTNVAYSFLLRTPIPTICIGQTLTIGVTIISQANPPDDETVLAPENTVLSIESVYVEAAVNSAILSSSGSPSQPVGSINNFIPFEGRFEFTGVAAGRTTIEFTGEVRNFLSRYPVHDSVDVRVIPCHLKVVTNARWFQRLIGGTVTVYAVVYDGEMAGDASGVYTGMARVVWLVYAAIPGCSQSNTLHFGTVDLRGNLNQNDQITVTLAYAPVPGSEIVRCPLGNGGGAVFANAHPLNATVPVYGGVVTLQQALDGPAGAISGRSYVYVVPLAD
jgi:hypothetical protein